MLKSALEHAVHQEEIPRDVARAPQRTSTGGLTTLPTKTRASERRIALSVRCAASLQLHHEQRQRESMAAGSAWRHRVHIFTTTQGRSIDPTNLIPTFTTLLRNASLCRIRFHDRKPSTATLLLEQGVELVVIKGLLGNALGRADDGNDDPPTAAIVR
ncbi:tyrosine-type recombinase/integrase [Streptomyces murinus]|uniref:tyrosine-type recombinase/integrase n=1 Tax=Streptomyces murinus TaxID=33900 RepID=UPI003F44FF08